jgi:hypothetical protein
MFIPSLSWLKDDFEYKVGSKRGVFRTERRSVVGCEKPHLRKHGLSLDLKKERFPYVCPEPVLAN